MKKLVALLLFIFILSGCTDVTSAAELSSKDPSDISYKPPYKICSSPDGRYSVYTAENSEAIKVYTPKGTYTYDYWNISACCEIFEGKDGNVYILTGPAKGLYSEIHILSFEDKTYIDNMLSFSDEALKEKIFPSLTVNYDETNRKLGLSTSSPAYEGKNYVEYSLPHGDIPTECYYKVSPYGVTATMDSDLCFTLTFPLEYKVKNPDGTFTEKPTYLYAETKLYYFNKQFVIGYKDADGNNLKGFIHVYSAKTQ